MTRKTHRRTSRRGNRSRSRRQRGGFDWNPFASSTDSTMVTNTDSNQGFLGNLMSKTKDMGSNIMSKTKDMGSNANTEIGDMASGFTSKIGDYASNSWDSAKNLASSDVPLTTSTPASTTATASPSTGGNVIPMGGKRRRIRGGTLVFGGKDRDLRGGQPMVTTFGGGNQDLNYASPVSGLKVAEPTTMQYYANGTDQYSTKGGSRRRRRSRKHRRIRRSRRHRRSRRY
jgi:hypothetical protein